MRTSTFDLTNTVVLVTGAAGLLGKEHCIALLQAGGTVVMTDVNQERLSTVSQSFAQWFPQEQIITRVMDVTDESQVAEIAADLLSVGKPVDVLVNNAAIDPKVMEKTTIQQDSRLENFSLERWNMEFNVGLTGAFICSKVFGTQMANRKYAGNIVNIASDLGVIAPDQRLYSVEGLGSDEQPVKPVTYSVIKFGLIGLTKYLATYWAANGIRCNALSPSGVFDGQSDEFVSRIENLIPLKRMATPKEYHGALQFLCSKASKYMNGHNLIVDGGRSVW